MSRHLRRQMAKVNIPATDKGKDALIKKLQTIIKRQREIITAYEKQNEQKQAHEQQA